MSHTPTPPKTRSRSRTVSEFVHSKAARDTIIPMSPLFQLVPVKEGYLQYKKKKRWIVLDSSFLHVFKGADDFKMPLKISLQCSAVRPVINGFEVITTSETHCFSIDKEQDGSILDEWIAEIRNVCDKLVLTSIGGSEEKNLLTKTYSKIISQDDIDQASAISHDNLSEYQKKAMKIAMREGNRICADCKALRPEWASINLGIFICIDCSGVHRSFGSHISKVRSVKLDKWDEESLKNIDEIGNIKANEYWEHNIPQEHIRPDNFDYTSRKQWLALKYIDKRFTPDWKEEELEDKQIISDSKLISQNKRLEEIKNAALNIKKQEYKQAILKLLEEDEEFRNEMRILLLKDIDLDLIKKEIEKIKQNEKEDKEVEDNNKIELPSVEN